MTDLEASGVAHESKRLVLVPFGILAAAEDEAELLARRKLSSKRRHECIRCCKGVVDLDYLRGCSVGELINLPANGPGLGVSDLPLLTAGPKGCHVGTRNVP